MVSSNISLRRLVATGVVLLVVGFVFMVTPQAVIGGLEQQLRAYPEASEQWKANLQEKINDQITMQVTFFNPVSSLLFAAGIAMIGYSIVSKVIQE